MCSMSCGSFKMPNSSSSHCISLPTPWQMLANSHFRGFGVRNGNAFLAPKFPRERRSNSVKIEENASGLYSLGSETVKLAIGASDAHEPRTQTGSKSSFSRIREILNESLFDDTAEEEQEVGDGKEARRRRGRRGSKRSADSPSKEVRRQLDMCSKEGNVAGAIELYDLAQSKGIPLGQYQYTVLLYLCSSAALGVVRSAKSGNTPRTADMLDVPLKNDNLKPSRPGEPGEAASEAEDASVSVEDGDRGDNVMTIIVSEELKKYALRRGIEIYERMVAENVRMNEATLTAVARMAMSMGDGDLAFEMVKQMKQLGINPKLRSYGPALSAFCSCRNVEKAFTVEKHMLDHGVYPEEPELELLLKVSVEASMADRVYEVLHKIRANRIKVSSSTAEMIAKWFESKTAATIGKKKWNRRMIQMEMENRGGGWHGQGWLGCGKWKVSSALIGDDAICGCCGEQLSIIDLDPLETEKFAESVASLAITSERDSGFEKFQKWLDYHGDFEAVVDGANVGLCNSRKFNPSKIGAVVNAIRQKLPSTRWALIVLHNRRLTGHRMNDQLNKQLVEKWKNADALYATPTGSNDDWYWLYAAIKCKCLMVTNDEMRDHIFQLLGDDFFPKWKERHQVRFEFTENGPVLHMPPPYSVVIQESENGNWHVPLASENGEEADRSWLCITRSSPKPATENGNANMKNGVRKADAAVKREEIIHNSKESNIRSPKESYRRIMDVLAMSVDQETAIDD